MKNEIRILMVEDDAAHAEIIAHTLRKDGLVVVASRVETEAEYREHLKPPLPDAILADHRFATFDGFKALAIAKQECPEVPVLFVTGGLGEDVAIDAFERGATDYILKSQLSHLAPAVRRALREVEERASRKHVEQERDQLLHELKEALTQLKTLTGLLPVCCVCRRIRHPQHGWVPLGAFLQQHTDAALTQEVCPECALKIAPGISQSANIGRSTETLS